MDLIHVAENRDQCGGGGALVKMVMDLRVL
jgi:hypothetical protein